MAGKNSVFIDNSAPAVDAGWLNIIQTEENNVITTSGQTLSDGTLNQQTISIASYAAQGGVFCTDSGTADNYVLTQISPFVAPFALKNGLRVIYRPGNANTGGACNANVFGFGNKSVKLSDGSTNPPANALNANADVELRYNGTVYLLSSSITAGSAISVLGQTVAVDITSLTVDASPDPAADYILTYDASATSNKKVLLENALKGLRFGTFSALTLNTVYQAAYDGFVVGYDPIQPGGFNILSDASNPPTTIRSAQECDNLVNPGGTCSPIKSGNYYKVTPLNSSSTVVSFFIPLLND